MSIYGRTSLSSARNGKYLCTLTSLTFRRLLNASSKSDFGTLWGTMDYIRTFKALYYQSSSCVKEGGRYSNWFEVKSGVRQGCVMCGSTFVLIID